MSDTPDKSSQTEDASEKKLSDARKKGDTPFSREAGQFLNLVAFTVALGAFAPGFCRWLTSALTPLIERPDDLVADAEAISPLLGNFFGQLAGTLLPILGLVLCAGVLGAVVQGNAGFITERIRPKLDRLSPKEGFRRIFGTTTLVEFTASFVKVLIVGAATAYAVVPTFGRAESLVLHDPSALPSTVKDLTVQLLIGVTACMGLIATCDLVWRRVDWLKRQRMTKQEVKDEHRQAEGDPAIKAKQRDLRRRRARRRMLEAVPKATVVVVNPTHYAVALRYVRNQDPVPVCVAKGVDLVALKIRELAEGAGVPVVEDPPLARALHAAFEVDKPISKEFYRAVAEVISFVFAESDRAGRVKRPAAPRFDLTESV